MKTTNITSQNIEKIAALFPNCLTETKDDKGNTHKVINFELLKQELNDSIIEDTKERYQMTWPGKREALMQANTPINKTLRPYREESVNFDATQNLYIEGDNLEALKLLQESYLGKVKMIYIDPPYNTGKDFVYKDKFKRSAVEELEASGQVDEKGGRLIANTESNGRFHSDWLSMMYPRLKIARNLLSDDGVIFISLDDGEIANLRKMCDEVFGENNFINNVIWQKKYAPQNDAKWFSDNHDHILVYAKDKNIWRPVLLPRSDKQNKYYKYDDNDGRGLWRSDNILVKSFTKDRVFPIINPNTNEEFYPPQGRCWRYNKNTLYKMLEENRIYFGKDGTGAPQVKRYLCEVKDGVTPLTIWLRDDVGDNQDGKNELNSFFEIPTFDTPKPTKLIKRMIHIGTDKDDIVLDFFSGSSTTAHSVILKNFEDGGNRQFIMVQLPEELDEKSEAFKAGYKTIVEIGKERIRRAGQKIKEENTDKEGIENLDVGFRVLKVDSSNMKDVYYTPDAIDQSQLQGLVDNIKENRTSEDLLFQVLLDWGVDLTLPITKEIIMGKEVFFVDEDTLAACFDEGITEELVKELASREVMRVVLKDSGFVTDAMKNNVDQIFAQLSPDTEVRAI